MSPRKALLPLTIATYVASGLLASTSHAVTQDTSYDSLQRYVDSGDISLADKSVKLEVGIKPNYINIMAIENPQLYKAGEPFTIGALLIVGSKLLFTLGAAANYATLADIHGAAWKAGTDEKVIAYELAKYDNPEMQLERLAELAVDMGYSESTDINVVKNQIRQQFSAHIYDVTEGAVAATMLDTVVGLPIFSILSGIGNSVNAGEFYKDVANAKLEMWKNSTTTTAALFTQTDVSMSGYGIDADYYASVSELVRGGEFTSTSDLSKWNSSKIGVASGYSAFGPITAPTSSTDEKFGVVHTGLGDASGQGWLSQTFSPHKSSNAVFNVRYNFITTEFPQYLGYEYNDGFTLQIQDINSGATKTLASFAGNLNGLFKETDPVVYGLPASILDRVDTGAGQTGWVTKSSAQQIALKSGNQYRIYISVNDVGDKLYDSALLIDKISLR